MTEIHADIEAIANDFSLFETKNFKERMEAIDFLEFNSIDHIQDLLLKSNSPPQLFLLKEKAEKLKAELEEINIKLFDQLRETIRTKTYKGFKNLINGYINFDLINQQNNEPGYDHLDLLVNGLFPSDPIPEQSKKLEPEMVFYQKTPARIVFELVEKCPLEKNDVFFDLGSGLGQVAILINLLTGIAVNGIEFDRAFCEYATNCASDLKLAMVEFMNIDARDADYSKGTVFFLYTPFTGEILQTVLRVLHNESLTRKIKIITYGPCTAEVALQGWLNIDTPKDIDSYKLGVFNTL